MFSTTSIYTSSDKVFIGEKMYYLIYFRIRERRDKTVLKGYSKTYSRLGMVRRAFEKLSRKIAKKYTLVEENIESEYMYRVYERGNETIIIWIIPTTMIG